MTSENWNSPHSYHGFIKCGIEILLPLVRLKIDLCWEKEKLEGTIILKTVKAFTSNPNNKPLPINKTLEIDPFIRFYEIENVY